MFDTYTAIFARRARAYHDAMARWPDARAAEFACALAPLPPLAGGLVCDMPAGGGYLRQRVGDAGGRYLAVEPTADFFAACGEGNGARRMQAPIDAVPVADGAIDHVVSLAGLHHVPDLDAVFAEMRRIVRPGGTVVIVDVAADSATARFLNGFVARHTPMGHDGRFLDERTAQRIERAGLTITADTIEHPAWSFADVEEMGAFCTRLFGLEGVATDAVAAEMLSRFDRCDGTGAVNIAWSLRRIVCVAG